LPPRLVGADDATLLAAAENPRTGEVWLTEPDGLEPSVPLLGDDARALIEIEGPNGDWWVFVASAASDDYGVPCD
jgi:hypothetical protein